MLTICIFGVFEYAKKLAKINVCNFRRQLLKVKLYQKVSFAFVSLITVLAIFLNTFAASRVYAEGGRDVSDRITSLSVVDKNSGVAEQSYKDGEWVKVQAEFSATKGEIHGGDYIKMSWPKVEDAWLESFNGREELYTQENVHVGEYIVDSQGARVVFNDNVNGLQNVHGDFSFNVKVRNSSTQDKTVPINSGDKTVDVLIKGISGGSSDPSPAKQEWYGEKTGSMSTYLGKNTIVWGLYLNSYMAQLGGDITVTDTIQGGQKLLRYDDGRPAAIGIWIDGAKQYYSMDDFNKVYSNSYIRVNGDTIEVRLNAREFSGHSANLTYYSEVTDTDFEYFPRYDNTANVTYQLLDQQSSSQACSDSVENNFGFDAHVYGTRPGELKIIKNSVDESGKKTRLPGVVFEIICPDGQTKMERTTDAEGVIDINNLPAGTYKVREISAPKTVTFDDKKVYEVKVSATENGRALVVDNQKKKESIPWTDYSKNPSKTVVPWTPLTPTTDHSSDKPEPDKPVVPDQPKTPDKPVVPDKPNVPAVVPPKDETTTTTEDIVVPSDNKQEISKPSSQAVVPPKGDEITTEVQHPTFVPSKSKKKNKKQTKSTQKMIIKTSTKETSKKLKPNSSTRVSIDKKEKSSLPQTGEALTSLALIGSMIMILGAAMLLVAKKRQR